MRRTAMAALVTTLMGVALFVPLAAALVAALMSAPFLAMMSSVCHYILVFDLIYLKTNKKWQRGHGET